MQRGVVLIAHDQPVVEIEEGKGVGGQLDGVPQPAKGMARLADVAPQRDPTAFGRASRLDLDDAAIGHGEVEGTEIAACQLCTAARHEAFDAAAERLGRDFAGRRFHPHDVAIAQTDQLGARGQGAEHIVEMLIGVDQPFGGIIEGDGDAQAIQRQGQRRDRRLARQLDMRRQHLLCFRKAHARNPFRLCRRVCAPGLADWLRDCARIPESRHHP